MSTIDTCSSCAAAFSLSSSVLTIGNVDASLGLSAATLKSSSASLGAAPPKSSTFSLTDVFASVIGCNTGSTTAVVILYVYSFKKVPKSGGG
ncbi:hypothetical protein IW262DRAFT_802474 [Armillaria fumosa]|nr:hypothetical protein IW262DRAFT_802474 [Armillaria fumosa]